MFQVSATSRQPVREAWTMDRLINERSISLGYSLDSSSFGVYTSALNSYLTFCNLHHFPVDPTPDTLSSYVVFLSSHISPKSVNSYLSGICRQLEPFFPDICQHRKSLLVSRTVAGCLWRFGTPVKRKKPFSHADLQTVIDSLPPTPSHDDLLFCAILHALVRLGELVFPDKRDLHNYRKLSLHHPVQVSILPPQFSFFLPSHKGDRTFEGNTILVQQTDATTDPYSPFLAYLNSRDALFPLHLELWLTSHASVPTRHWFLSRLRVLFPSSDYASHSIRSGGATSLAEAGVDFSLIQAIGRWSSTAFAFTSEKIPFSYMLPSLAALPTSHSIRLLFFSFSFFCSFPFHRCALFFFSSFFPSCQNSFSPISYLKQKKNPFFLYSLLYSVTYSHKIGFGLPRWASATCRVAFWLHLRPF